jgi:glycosyltransferase involved in cell wall biosynthesis
LNSQQSLPPVAKIGVSFVVPVFNKVRWLPAVLQSIAAQTGDFEREYIFVDDGSTDGSGEVLREATRGWPNCRLIFQDNRGAARANNWALEQVSQPYVKFVDADDLLVANATGLLINALHGRTDACLAFGAASPYDELPPALPGPEEMNSAIPGLVENSLRRVMATGWFNPSQMLVRTDCIRAVGGSDIRISHTQDYTLLLRLAHRWPYLDIGTRVALIQSTDPRRLTANKPEQLEEATLSLAGYLADHPEASNEAKLFACRRAAKRAALFTRRKRRWREFWLRHAMVARTSMPFQIQDPAAFVWRCATAFRPELWAGKSVRDSWRGSAVSYPQPAE